LEVSRADDLDGGHGLERCGDSDLNLPFGPTSGRLRTEFAPIG
jgi:hypothetical protein